MKERVQFEVAMANQDNQRKLHAFLIEKLRDQAEFTKEDVIAVTGWKKKSLNDYLSKQLRAYIRRLPQGRLKVKRSFARFGTFEVFQPLVTQVKNRLSQYKRNTYDALVIYEFLLPLTQEGKLRVALDELFYKDTVEALVRDLADESALEGAFPSELGENSEQHIARALNKIGDLFGGYSINHVSGRFRAAQIATRNDAAQQLVQHGRYLVDETTAVVRFIFRCSSSRREHGERFDLRATVDPDVTRDPKVRDEIQLIRGLFFSVFVDAVVTIVQGEDIIWLLEDSPLGRRLYELDNSKEDDDGEEGGTAEDADTSNENEKDDPE